MGLTADERKAREEALTIHKIKTDIANHPDVVAALNEQNNKDQSFGGPKRNS
jgi:hypothetical protein